jgi:homocitrate synthase NifV
MIRLIDKTLTVLDTTLCRTEVLKEFCELLHKMGIDTVEMDLSTAERLNSAFAEEFTLVRVENKKEDIRCYSRLSCHNSGLDVIPRVINEIQVNDIGELGLLEHTEACGNIRIAGLCDLMLHDFQSAFREIRRHLHIASELCPTNDCGCAGAILAEWLMEGGSGVGTFMGVGGFAPLEEVIMALHIAKQYRKDLDLSMMPRLCQLFTEISGIHVPPHKPIVGHAVFEVESGIHVDGILKNAANYEPFAPEAVGTKRRFVIGKHSGLASLKCCMNDLGYELEAEAFPLLLEEVRSEAVSISRALKDEEVLALVEKVRFKHETKSNSHGYHAS